MTLAAVTIAGALLRFATLDTQSFAFDEARTASLVELSFGGMLEEVLRSETNPPLYSLAAWLWATPFGAGEVGLRSLSALFGTLTIPASFAAARQLASTRAAIVTAALVAANPLLIWYSQEARSYALLVFVTTIGFAFFARALNEAPTRALIGWAVLSALALTIHYFAFFWIVPQAVLLLWRGQTRRRALAALAGVAAAGAALLPVAFAQRCLVGGQADVPAAIGLLVRLPKKFLLGLTINEGTGEVVLILLSAIATATALVLLMRRGDRADQLAAAVAAVVVAGMVSAAVVLRAAVLVDVDVRTVVPAVVPFLFILALGVASAKAGYAGFAAGTALVLTGVAASLLVLGDESFQREDWRGLASPLKGLQGARVLVVTPGDGPLPLMPYLRGVRELPADGARVNEIVLAALPRHGDTPVSIPLAADDSTPPPPAGFRLEKRVQNDSYVVVRYTSSRSVAVSPAELQSARVDRTQGASLLLQDPRRGYVGYPDLSCDAPPLPADLLSAALVQASNRCPGS